MAKKILTIEPGVWWTKIAVTDGAKKPYIYEAFSFKTPEHSIEDGYIRDREAFSLGLKTELAKRHIEVRDVIFLINTTKVISRELPTPVVKDKQLPGVVETHSREAFPMDISNSSVFYNKMGIVNGDPKKDMKLMLLAIPDNLLNSYYSFAKEIGLNIISFEYIGNSAVSYMKNNFPEDSILVQLEEQMTVVSIVKDKEIVFQRTAPYGYGTALSAMLNHPILGVEDEYQAFEFLMHNDVINNNAELKISEGMTVEEAEFKKQQLQDAYEDIREALGYHIRVVYTALEYYKNQTKKDYQGVLRLIGDGVRVAGIERLFEREIPVRLDRVNYMLAIKSGKNISFTESNDMIGFLSVIGAAIEPIDIKAKEMRESKGKKKDLQTARLIIASSLLVGVVLVLTSSLRLLMATSEQKDLKERINQLSYIQSVYDENEAAEKRAASYIGFDALTKTENEAMEQLIAELEKKLPSKMTVEALNISESSIMMTMTADRKETIEQCILNLKTIPFLANIDVPAIVENDEEGKKEWSLSVSANYVEPSLEDDTEITESDGTVME